MKKTSLVLSLLILASPFAGARGSRGFTGGRGASGGSRGASAGARGFSGGGGFSRTVSRPSFGRATAFHAGARPGFSSSARPGGFSGGFGGFSRGLSRPTFVRAASFHPAATRRFSGVRRAMTSAPPAWTTPGALIRTAGQQPVYSNPGNGGTLSVDGGGFIAINQAQAHDVGRGAGITWSAPDRAPSAGAGTGGGGSGASSNGPAFNPAF